MNIISFSLRGISNLISNTSKVDISCHLWELCKTNWVSLGIAAASGFKGILLLFCSTNSYLLYQPTDRARVIKFLMCLSWYSPCFSSFSSPHPPPFSLFSHSTWARFNPTSEQSENEDIREKREIERRKKDQGRVSEKGKSRESGCVLSVAINLWIVPNYMEARDQSSRVNTTAHWGRAQIFFRLLNLFCVHLVLSRLSDIHKSKC